MRSGILYGLARKFRAVAMIGAGLIAPYALADTTLFTTQQDFSGWNNSSIVTSSSAIDIDGNSTNGAASGGGAGTPGSLQAVWSSGAFDYFYGPGEQGNAAFLAVMGTSATGDGGFTAASGFIKVDYTKPPPGTGNYFQLGLVLNYSNNFGQTFGTEVDNGNGTFTATIPYTINAVSSPQFTYFQLGLIYNSNYNTNTPFNIDNIRVVPEPASMGLLGAGALASLRRRQR